MRIRLRGISSFLRPLNEMLKQLHFRREEREGFIAHNLVHHLANVGETSTAFWIFFLALTTTTFFLINNAFYDG
jgi:hypothetical protein